VDHAHALAKSRRICPIPEVGLDTGPLLAALALGADRFTALTGVAAVLLTASMFGGIIAARLADRRHQFAGSRPVPNFN
jgi:hypothetical protein